jgi:IS30 family transposase
MGHGQTTEDRRKGKHLTWDDRQTIEAMVKDGIPSVSIASMLGRSLRTIQRELNRGKVTHIDTELREYETYSCERAQQDYDINATAKGLDLKLGSNRIMVNYISQRILVHRESPDIVAARMKQMNMSGRVCTKTIYSYIDMGLIPGVTNETLWEKRNHSSKTTKKIRRSFKRLARSDSIEKRPEHIENRDEFGHWEMDLVVGKQGGTGSVLLTIVERKTRHLITRKLPDKTQHSVHKALRSIEQEFGSVSFRKIFKTITVDNGSEFLDLDALEKSAFSKKARTKIYYAHPYSSWERGTNENTNRIIRRFIAKGHEISEFSIKRIKEIELWINNYPRRILDYLSPYELFNKETLALA